MNVIFGIMDVCDIEIDLIKHVGQWPINCSPVILPNIFHKG